MASANLTFTYFNIRGLGEVPRLILAYGQKDYKEVRVDREKWPEMKDKTPLGQLPLLDIDGEVYPQSLAIWSFLAKEFGLYPSSNKDQLVVDVVLGVLTDTVKAQASWFYLPDSDEKEQKRVEAVAKAVIYLDYLEDLLKKNGTGYFVGNSVTLADVAVFDLLTGYARKTLTYSPEKYPLLAQNQENVLKVDSIKAYVDSRPDLEI